MQVKAFTFKLLMLQTRQVPWSGGFSFNPYDYEHHESCPFHICLSTYVMLFFTSLQVLHAFLQY